MKKLFICLLALLIFSSAAYAENIASGEWTATGNTEDCTVKSDSFVIKSVAEGVRGFMFDDISVKGNKKYRITVDIYAQNIDALSEMTFSVGAKNSEGEWVELPEKNVVQLNRGSYGWRTLDIVCAVPKGCTSLCEMKFELTSKTLREQNFSFRNLNIEMYQE